MLKYIKIQVDTIRKYFAKRSAKHDGYLEQVLGEEGVKDMANVWKEHGQTLEYIREILEYQFILDFYPDKKQAQLVADIFEKQNKFLKECHTRLEVERELKKVKDVSENKM